MPTTLMISMLKQANNGDELLAILDTLAAKDEAVEYNEPTLESIPF